MRLLFERLAFTALIVGIILAGYAAYRVVTINNKLDKNIAEQVRRSGGLTESQVTTSEGFGLMSADLERRELRQDRNAAYVFGGVGLALIGVGWLGYDVLNSRKRRAVAQAQAPASSEALET
jgi:hypothetical protein